MDKVEDVTFWVWVSWSINCIRQKWSHRELMLSEESVSQWKSREWKAPTIMITVDGLFWILCDIHVLVPRTGWNVDTDNWMWLVWEEFVIISRLKCVVGHIIKRSGWDWYSNCNQHSAFTSGSVFSGKYCNLWEESLILNSTAMSQLHRNHVNRCNNDGLFTRLLMLR